MLTVGDKVRTIAPDASSRKIGTVIRVFQSNDTGDSAEVEFYNSEIDEYKCRRFYECQLAVVEHFSSTVDDYSIAVVSFLGQDYIPTKSSYYIRVYKSDNITIDDYVICETRLGLRLGQVSALLTPEMLKSDFPYDVRAQVLNKIDVSNYIARKKNIKN